MSDHFLFLLSFDFSVLDVNAIFIDVSLLMVRSQLSVLISLDEDIIIVGSNRDVVVEFFDVFVVEFVEEVNDESSRDFIDFNPGRMNLITFCLSDSFGLITIDLEEFLGFNDVKTEVVVFPDSFLSWSDLSD